MKNKIGSQVCIRTLPIGACAVMLGFAVACGSGKNGDSALIKSNPGSQAAKVASQIDVLKSFPDFKVADEQNQNLISRMLGVSAQVKSVDNPNDPDARVYQAKVSILVAEEKSTDLALQLIFEGAFSKQASKVQPKELPKDQVVDPKADPKVDPKADPKQAATQPRETDAPAKSIVFKLNMAESSSEAKRFALEVVCANSDCSTLHVRLVEKTEQVIAGESKKIYRQFVAAFSRKEGSANGDNLELSYAAGKVGAESAIDARTGRPLNGKAQDARNLRSERDPVRLSFEEAVKAFKEKGVISPSTSQVPKDVPAPAQGAGASPAAVPAAAPAPDGAAPAAAPGLQE